MQLTYNFRVQLLDLRRLLVRPSKVEIAHDREKCSGCNDGR